MAAVEWVETRVAEEMEVARMALEAMAEEARAREESVEAAAGSLEASEGCLEGAEGKAAVEKVEVETGVEETGAVTGAVMVVAVRVAESEVGREGKVELEAREAEWEMVEEMATGWEVVAREEVESEEEDWEAEMAEVEMEEEGEVPSLVGMEAERVETTEVAETEVEDLDWVW